MIEDADRDAAEDLVGGVVKGAYPQRAGPPLPE